MYERAYSARFKKDLRLSQKRGRNIAFLESIVDTLASGKKLAAKHRDHALKGKYMGCRECHIEPDWLLIYKIDKGLLILLLTRTGTHSDLYDE